MPERISICHSTYKFFCSPAFQRIRGHTKNALTQTDSNFKDPERRYSVQYNPLPLEIQNSMENWI